MTRKPQQSGPTAEDISRHEEAVGQYLATYRADNPEDATMQAMKPMLVSEQLTQLLGRCHMMLSFDPTQKEVLENAMWLTVTIRLQGWLEENPRPA